MSEIRTPRPDAPRRFDGFFDRKMSRMFGVLQRIEHQDIKIMQQAEGFFGNAAHIGAIGKISDAKTQDGHVAVKKGNRLPCHSTDLEWTLDETVDQMRPEHLLFGRRRGECVAETSREGLLRLLIGPDVEGGFGKGVESPEIIEPHDVIGMPVGDDDSVNAIDVIGDALQAQFGRDIDEDAKAVVGDRNGGTSTLVARVGAFADCAVAADHGNSGAGAGSQE